MDRRSADIDRRTLLDFGFRAAGLSAVVDCRLLAGLTAVDVVSLASGVPFEHQRESGDAQFRELKLLTTETSGSDIAVSPDGRTLVFTILGQLFRLGLDGGTAEQISTGPFFHSDPCFSPNGRTVAFARDGEAGRTNIYRLELDTGELRQITTEDVAKRPVWSPDGRTIAYLSEVGAAWDPAEQPALPTVVRRVSSAGGAPQTVQGQPALRRSLFYMESGDVAWSTAMRMPDGQRWQTVAQRHDGSELGRVAGWADRMVFRAGKLTALTFDPVKTPYGSIYPMGALTLVAAGQSRTMAQIRGAFVLPAFALDPPGETAFISGAGGISVVGIERGSLRRLNFSAPVELRVRRRPAIKAPLLKDEIQSRPLLIRNARIVDPKSGEVSGASRLYLRDGRIERIEPESNRPAGNIETLDADGKFVLPGLIDLDVRIRYPSDVFLGYGITTIREFGGTPSSIEEINEKARVKSGAWPRTLLAGPFLEGAKSRWSGPTIISTGDVEGTRLAVARTVADGAVAIRPYATMAWDQQVATAKEARRLGVPVIGHATSLERVVKGVVHGFDTLEHLGWGERYYGDVVQLLAATQTAWMPTFGIMGGTALLLREQPERLNDAMLQRWTPADRLAEAKHENMFSVTQTADLRAYVGEHLEFARQLDSAGGAILLGTASPIQNTFHGASLHWEMELLARAGLPPVRLLRAVTSEAAKRLGLQDDLGSLAPGSRADLILLDHNPMVDIRNTRNIRRVVIGGRVLKTDS